MQHHRYQSTVYWGFAFQKHDLLCKKACKDWPVPTWNWRGQASISRFHLNVGELNFYNQKIVNSLIQQEFSEYIKEKMNERESKCAEKRNMKLEFLFEFHQLFEEITIVLSKKFWVSINRIKRIFLSTCNK